MTKKILLLLLVGWITFYACSKKYSNSPDDVGGDLYLRGRVFLFNNFTGDGTYQVLKGLPVKIRYATDPPGNFLNRTTTDTAGYYTFKDLKPNINYIVDATDSVGGLQYSNSRSDILTESKDTTS